MKLHVIATSETKLRADHLEPGMLVKLDPVGWVQVTDEYSTIDGHAVIHAPAMDLEPDQIVTVMTTRGGPNEWP